MKVKNIAILCLTLVVALTATGCETFNNFRNVFLEEDQNADSVIRIGVFQPLSGAHQRYGELERRGIELAHELFPTVLGRDVELIFEDNMSDIYIAETAIKRLIERNPLVVLGSFGEIYSLIAAPHLEEARIPAIAITNTNRLVTSSNPLYFRVRFVYSFEGVTVARYAVETLEVSSAAIFRPANDESAVAVTQAFWDTMVRLTGDEDVIVNSQDFDPNEEDFTEQLVAIRDSSAEVVFMPSNIYDASRILMQAEEVGVTAMFLGINNWDTPELIELAGEDAAEGIAFSAIFDPEAGITETTEIFLNAYRERYGEDALPSSEVALAFDAYLIALDAIERSGMPIFSERVAMALARTTDFPGASGSITFDERGDPIKSVVLKTVRRGEIVLLDTIEPVFGDEDEENEEGE